MGGYIILILLFIIGTVILAHSMGKDYGYEHGYNDARHDILCAECRMSEGHAIIEPIDYTYHINERKYQ